MSNELHPVQTTNTFADVLLPLALPKPYTYFIPEEMLADVRFGQRVEVQLGKQKRYSGIVINLHNNQPEAYAPRPILSIVDQAPIINQQQLKLWNWMSRYYCCTLGEVMNAALPAHLKLASETKVTLGPLFDEHADTLNDKEYMIAEALRHQEELTIGDLQKILQQQSVHAIVNRMIDKRILYLREEMSLRYKPKTIQYVRLQEPYATNPDIMEEAFELTARSHKQTDMLMHFIQLTRQEKAVRKQELVQKSGGDYSVLKALEKKKILESFEQEISRIAGYEDDLAETPELSEQQIQALAEIREAFVDTEEQPAQTTLLHGVTGSGKTRVYIELMQDAIDKGEQVLYLLPEIALTTQIISRLEKIFGDKITVYHSRLNNNERVELWHKVAQGIPILLGPRSSLFLPFNNLKLVIVDEEHDASYKQQDPAPRYQGRDTAIYLAHLANARVLLGTATPSMESYHNAKKGKYKLVEMPERFGGIQMPEIKIADLRQEAVARQANIHFSSMLLEHMQAALDKGEQIILFQNRRGYAPNIRCMSCGWTQECVHCDVSLTYHKFQKNLLCHYCGYRTQVPKKCPACEGAHLELQGFGTEKIEDDLKIYFPQVQIGRMDLDTVRSKNAHSRIINDFEERRLDILVGTQMVTKGLDFENVGLVGVLSADQLLQFPDFRSTERAFQLMVQVSGRAGRKKKQGTVVIQALNPVHPVLDDVLANNYKGFYKREIAERQSFGYPPFARLIRIQLKHRKPDVVNEGAKLYAHLLSKRLKNRVNGPAIPYISRVRGQYILDILIKLERNPKVIAAAKQIILETNDLIQGEKGFSTLRINVNVDL
ncbi:MAG: primosomal protein N' [Bacteroidetes bacterium]|nr:primosomal protein N' [Bacteroidota bacterium]